MFIHRENALTSPSTYIIIALYKEIIFKKFNTQWDQNIHHDTSNCTFFLKKFLEG